MQLLMLPLIKFQSEKNAKATILMVSLSQTKESQNLILHKKKLQLKLNPKNIPILTLWGPDEEILNKLTFKPLVLELDEDFLESLNKTIDFSEIKFA